MRCLRCVRPGTVNGQPHYCPGPDARAVAEWVWLMFGKASFEDQVQTIIEDGSTLGHAVALAHDALLPAASREERASQPAAEAPNATVPLADEAGTKSAVASEPLTEPAAPPACLADAALLVRKTHPEIAAKLDALIRSWPAAGERPADDAREARDMAEVERLLSQHRRDTMAFYRARGAEEDAAADQLGKSEGALLTAVRRLLRAPASREEGRAASDPQDKTQVSPGASGRPAPSRSPGVAPGCDATVRDDWEVRPGSYDVRASCPRHPTEPMRRCGEIARCSYCGDALEMCNSIRGWKLCVREKGHTGLHVSPSGSAWPAASGDEGGRP